MRNLTVVTSLAFLASTVLADPTPPDFRFLVPPARPRVTLWAEAEQAESNIGVMPMENTYGGEHRGLSTAAEPGPAGYCVRFKISVPEGRAGRFQLYGACGPMGQAFVSPTELKLDASLLRRIRQTPAGSGAGADSRKAFLKMVEDAQRGDCPFTHVLVYDIKRFGRLDNDERGYYRHILKQAGMEVVYASENFAGDDTDDLLRPVKQWQGRQELKDLSKVTVRGMLSKGQRGQVRVSPHRPYRLRWLRPQLAGTHQPQQQATQGWLEDTDEVLRLRRLHGEGQFRLPEQCHTEGRHRGDGLR